MFRSQRSSEMMGSFSFLGNRFLCQRELTHVLKRARSFTRNSRRSLKAAFLVNLATPSGRVASRPTSTASRTPSVQGDDTLLECSEAAIEDCKDVLVVPEFINAEEGESLLQEISRTLRGKRYLYNHWDGAIEGYRETEKTHWVAPANTAIVRKLRDVAEAATTEGEPQRALNEVHILDLAKDGFIKPHIDSVKFCGDVIVGLSLLSPCVMVYQHETDTDRWIHALLPPLSLYIMRGHVRYNYTHAIPVEGEQSRFKGQTIKRDRRLSVLSRTHPSPNSSNS